jgi:prepilin-type N-terminal cleavage/methylation domain-containing protein
MNLSKNRKGITLLELLIAVVLLSVVFLGVSAIYITSFRIHTASNDKVIVGYEAQYAIQHIYKYVMQAIGDKASPAVDVVSSEKVNIRIPNNDPVSMANYNDVTTCSYYKSEKALIFDNGSTQESLIPKVAVTDVNFTKSGNVLTGYIKAYYNDSNQPLTFYFACYPRLASFK